MHSIGRKRGTMVTLEALKSIDEFVPANRSEEALKKLVESGLRLKAAWPFAFDEALNILILLEKGDQDKEAFKCLSEFVEKNCSYKAYVPYAKVAELFQSGEQLSPDEESIANFCGLLSEIADAATEHYKKKFSF